MNHLFHIEQAVLDALPKLSIFFAVVRNINLSKVDKKGISKLLEASWSLAREQVTAYPNVQSHPNILLWRQAFQ
ncbi:MAG: hypothetical protein K2X94_04430 [Amoebophilaceae bacterium]|nr:hypothetical protein [Amoebophilaceae bacterium]